jgi:hypothetical protein
MYGVLILMKVFLELTFKIYSKNIQLTSIRYSINLTQINLNIIFN